MQSIWFLFWWRPLLSANCFQKFCLSGTLSENSQAVCNLGNRMARGYWFEHSSVLFEKWGTIPFETTTLNRTPEYLRHNFPWDRFISCQTNNPWPSYSQDINPPDYFLRGYVKDRVVKTIHSQERTSSEKKSDGLHKKCSIELWTILLFELLLCCHTAARCMERT